MGKYLVEVNVKGRKGRRYFYAVYDTTKSRFLTPFVEGLESFRRKYPQYLGLDPINWKEVFGSKVRAHLRSGYIELTHRVYTKGRKHYHIFRITNPIYSSVGHKVVSGLSVLRKKAKEKVRKLKKSKKARMALRGILALANW